MKVNVETTTTNTFMIWLATTFGTKEEVEEEDWSMIYYTFFGRHYVTEYHDHEEDYHLGER